jgi:hypothetical protein
MSALLAHQDVNSSYQSSLSELTQAIEWGQGHFALILAHCNSSNIRQRALYDLEHCDTFPLYTVSLQPEAELMLSSISSNLKHLDANPDPSQPLTMQNSDAGAIAISGFEDVNHIDTLLSSADTVRDELRKVFHCPLIWWMSDAILVKLIRIAPNIHSWFTFVEFLSSPEPVSLEPVSLEPELKLLTSPIVTAPAALNHSPAANCPIVWPPAFTHTKPGQNSNESVAVDPQIYEPAYKSAS